jgi:hypothetical protein
MQGNIAVCRYIFYFASTPKQHYENVTGPEDWKAVYAGEEYGESSLEGRSS